VQHCRWRSAYRACSQLRPIRYLSVYGALRAHIRDRDRDPRERDVDPRDVLVEGLELPRGLEREIVLDGHDRYELNGDDSRSLATVGAFRVVSERDLRDPRDETFDSRDRSLGHLRDEGLVRFVSLDGRERAVTLTERLVHGQKTHEFQFVFKSCAFDHKHANGLERFHDVLRTH